MYAPKLYDPIFFRSLIENARREDAGESDIADSVAHLRRQGWLAASSQVAEQAHPEPRSLPRQAGRQLNFANVQSLVRLAAANLSIARLFEGHVNALELIARYGDRAAWAETLELADAGLLFGVWGADGARPVEFADAGSALRGCKQFASGLGQVARALVTVGRDQAVQLVLIDGADAHRQVPGAWTMNGMRATVSGEYDCDAVTDFRIIGKVGDYHREPFFVGGVWRIAAITLGGVFALLDAARTALAARDRLQAHDQIVRLSQVLHQAYAALGLAERAAKRYREVDQAVDEQGRPAAPAEAVVALAIAARLRSEEVAQSAIAAVEQAIGLAHFSAGSETGRIARDLAVYIRQAARDAFAQRAGRQFLLATDDLLEPWYG